MIRLFVIDGRKSEIFDQGDIRFEAARNNGSIGGGLSAEIRVTAKARRGTLEGIVWPAC